MPAVTTPGGDPLPELAITAGTLLHKSAVLYGPSGSGKSFAIKHMMGVLSPHIDQIIVVSPTQPQNQSYTGYVEPPLIHTRVWLPDPSNPSKDDGDAKGAARFLEAVLQRQQMLASLFRRANNYDVITQLYKRVRSGDVDRLIGTLSGKRERALAALRSVPGAGAAAAKESSINENFKRMLVLIMKKQITIEWDRLMAARGGLSEDEIHSLTYIALNPNLLLIFDDCAAELKPLFNKVGFRKLFYQGRHSFVTSIYTMQDDTDLTPNLRKNTFISVFMDKTICLSYFEKAGNKFPKSVKERIRDIAGTVYENPSLPNCKTVYIRDDPKGNQFYHYTAKHVPKRMFGSSAIIEYCEKIRADDGAADKDNPYYKKFGSILG